MVLLDTEIFSEDANDAVEALYCSDEKVNHS